MTATVDRNRLAETLSKTAERCPLLIERGVRIARHRHVDRIVSDDLLTHVRRRALGQEEEISHVVDGERIKTNDTFPLSNRPPTIA